MQVDGLQAGRGRWRNAVRVRGVYAAARHVCVLANLLFQMAGAVGIAESTALMWVPSPAAEWI